MNCDGKEGWVYKILCDVPEEHVVYVGSTTQPLNERLSHHSAIQRNKQTALNKFIRKLGKEHFTIVGIEKSSSKRYRLEREKYWTEKLGCMALGFNRRLAHDLTEEEKEKARLTNYRNRDVICDNTGEVFLSCADAARSFGLHGSDVSECCARNLCQVHGYRFRYADIDRAVYVEFWNSRIRRNRAVRCIETGQVWKNIAAAATALGLTRKIIEHSCERTGKSRKTSLHFEYDEEYAPSPRHATQGSDTVSCGTSSMPESTLTDGSPE